MISLVDIRSPKQRLVGENSRANWFRYYAGFSVGFVEDILDRLHLPIGATLLDPWLGAGTTSQVATSKGFKIRGYDLNPAMVLVARARTLPSSAAGEIPQTMLDISRSYVRRLKRIAHGPLETDDSLQQWLQPRSARSFRLLERSVAKIVSHNSSSSLGPLWMRPSDATPTLAFFYVALFRTFRHFISAFECSNPTWVRVPATGNRIQVSPERLLNRFRKETEDLVNMLQTETLVMPLVGSRACVIQRASSLELPLPSRSVDAVISSPPYCTRIDYVRATLPELAVIGHPNGHSIRQLRENMIGTPTIDKSNNYQTTTWGNTCSRFLSLVEQHSSKASSTYYLKYFRQYFSAAFASLCEIDRVLRDSAYCVLVLQDSYYKEVRNDLPAIFGEMCEILGWKLVQEQPYKVMQTLAGVNPEVKAYRSNFHATESVLVLIKKQAIRHQLQRI